MKVKIRRLLTMAFLLLLVSPWACSKGAAADVSEVTDATFQKEVIDSGLPVLIDFWATWCGPCRMYGPIVDKMADIYKGRLKVVRVDIDHNAQLANFFRINAIPRTILMSKGSPVGNWVGYLSEEELKTQLDQILGALEKPQPPQATSTPVHPKKKKKAKPAPQA